jgi:hypothetical protein
MAGIQGAARGLDYIGVWAPRPSGWPDLQEQGGQGAPGHESAGYHGYWITDFTAVDPHFGTEADLRRRCDP